jgi:hypothetical protein
LERALNVAVELPGNLYFLGMVAALIGGSILGVVMGAWWMPFAVLGPPALVVGLMRLFP